MTTSAKKTDYQQNALDFLNKTSVKLNVKYLGYGHYFDGDKDSRSIYRFTLKRGIRSYSAKFGQSIVQTERGAKPSAYDILACLTKYDVGTFKNFCDEFGYSTDSISARKTYKDVCREFQGICHIWNESERMELAEIN